MHYRVDNMSMAKRIALKKRKRDDTQDSYMNCDFVLGSVAEVERLWSTAKHVLGQQHMGMTPIVLEPILFLKINRRYLDSPFSIIGNGSKTYSANNQAP